MNEPILDKGTELQGLSTAVLFPSIDLFGGPVRKAVGPLTPIVGVSLFQRTVLTLQRAGIRQLIVLSGPEEEQLKQALLKGPRVTVPVRWMPIREFPLDDPRTWESLAAEVRGFCLVSGVGTVFPRSADRRIAPGCPCRPGDCRGTADHRRQRFGDRGACVEVRRHRRNRGRDGDASVGAERRRTIGGRV